MLYTILFFNAGEMHSMINEKIYGINSEGHQIVLYENDKVRYILDPQNE
jgi:hypothetical protein